MSNCQGEYIGYNNSNDVGQSPDESESNMTKPIDPSTIKVDHSLDPILERKTDMYGSIRVYPPSGDPTGWADKSWKLMTDKTQDGRGLEVELRASSVYECFLRPHFIREVDKFSKKKA
jgi:hypothetical protein